MKRRKFLLGTGAAAAGGASLLGSGAFSSVEADRSIDVDVVGDGEAFLRLAPCTIDGSEHPNGAYVRETPDGTIAIDLSDGNDQVAGDGVNAEALSVFHNVFEICNQGTQDVCVDFELDVPEIPGPVPDRFDFEAGDPAVVFYRGSNREEYISTDGLDVDRAGAISLSIEGGECECVGLEVRAFGFDAGAELFADAELTIRAEAGADCEDGVADPPPGTDPRRLSTGVAEWQVTDLPPNASPPEGESLPYDAAVLENTPDVWVEPESDGHWVDPFGDGGLVSDPGNDEEPYVYELDLQITAGPRTLVIEEYSADNLVDLYLDGDRIGGTEDDRAYETLRSDIPDQTLEAGDHTLKAEVINASGSGNNPTGLLVGARLE